jgi:sugar/nucleoside kinase (ribokinase family)
MTVEDTGRRTFFHHRGANRLLARHHFDFNGTSARLFYLGYLMLLDTLDERDTSGRSGASRVLEAARHAGLTTVVDLVSVEHADFRRTVLSALPWVDHMIINEVEAGNLLGETLPDDDRARLEEAADRILALGVGEAVVIHSPAGGVAASRTEGTHAQGSVLLPRGLFRGSNGAGDAFAAGYLHGLHEGWALPRRLRLAVGTAACSLMDPAPSAGIRGHDACLELSAIYGAREWERLESGVPASTAT